MKRSVPALPFLGAVLPSNSASMSSRRPPLQHYRGSNDRNQRGRATFSNRLYGDQQQLQYVTGESHLGLFHGESNRSFAPRPLPPQNLQFRQQPPPRRQPSNQNRQFRKSPPFNQNRQLFNQTYRPQRPAKPMDYRNWEYAKKAPPHDCDKFTVLSYNILADYLAFDHRSKLYYHIPRHMLVWEWRKRNILFELGLWSADIMCFQEVDRFGDLEEALKVRGYSGIWKMRTGNAIDGCAVFWKTSRFKLLYEESIEFRKLGFRDNVAQICVLELLRQDNNADMSTLPTSSSSSNKVLICNIHVLYNPKRGEIKLGQVRTLLDRADVVSKTWNDAPVVLCGDFNCTPKSPLYNYISQQKLDLSEIHRDKVSGQASAEIRSPRPYDSSCNPIASPRQSSDNSVEAPLMVDSKPIDSRPDKQKENNLNQSLENVPSVNDDSQHQYPKSVQDASDVSVDRELHVEERKEILQDKVEQSTKIFHGSPGYISSQPIVNDGNTSPSLPFQASSSDASISISYVGDKQLEDVSTCELNDVFPEISSIEEDEDTFLSALHGMNDSLPDDFNNSLEGFVSDPNDSHPLSPDDKVLDDVSPGFNSEAAGVEKTAHNPSAWTPTEIATATGKADCMYMEHPLKLKSTYTQVEDCSGSRDPDGEPLVTSYNRCFFGTVDYIWCSEGLQTVKVLAPIAKHAMQWTPGFPTKKWGSDHIALASELSFTKDQTDNSIDVQ